MSSIGVKLLCLLYLLLAGQVAVCSHESLLQQESEHDSGESDTHELFCGGDCQNISSVAIISSPPASSYFPLVIGLAVVIGILFRLILLPLASSRAPPLAGVV
ncbi:MAG: hypothetical protein H8J66_11590 [Nitrospira sp.]|nr:hypothetical protein [Nitrospira sp.]